MQIISTTCTWIGGNIWVGTSNGLAAMRAIGQDSTFTPMYNEGGLDGAALSAV